MSGEEYLLKGVDVARMEAERMRRANSNMIRLERRFNTLEETVIALQKTVSEITNPKKAETKKGKNGKTNSDITS